MTYNGRPGPNVSQYLQNLNSIDPQPIDLPATDDYSNFADDLALFTNLEFVDFDQNIGADSNNGDESQYDATEEERARRLNASAGYRNAAKDAGLNRKAEGFMDEQFQFPDFATSIYPNVSDSTATTYPATSAQNTPFPIQPALSPASSTSAKSTVKRPSTAQHSTPPAISIEDNARYVAEEDKRRRNTAASARFRIKKKQREQEVERTAKEMTERVGILEARVKHLEMENEWLRSLIVDKSGNVPARKAGKKPDAVDAASLPAESEEERETKRRRKDGVGTKA